MSRIERALEKAVKIRKVLNDAYPAEDGADTPGAGASCDPSIFEAQGNGVDRARVNLRLVSVTDPNSMASEEYRKLRAKILNATAKNFKNTIMVTSAHSGEGKTVTAINLAVTMAQELDRTVLLIDADLRKPSIHNYLGLEPSHGLSDYLMSRKKLSEVLVKTGIGKLVLLPAGNIPENPAELLASERMKKLLHELKFRYRDRYIFCDSAPLLLAADSLSLCGIMDGVVLVAQAGYTDAKIATQALSLMQNSTILGVVFNNVPRNPAEDRYPYTRYGSKYYRPAGAGTAKMAVIDAAPRESAAATKVPPPVEA